MTLGRSASVWTLAAIVAGVLLYWALGTPADDGAPVPGFRQSGADLIAVPEAAQSDVRTIEIATAAKGLTLQREDGLWRMPSREGYPAAEEWVTQLLDSLFDATILFDRRLRQDEFAQYGLQPVTEQGSRALRISLRDPAGRPLLDLRVGNLIALRETGSERQGTLVALPDERRAAIVDKTLARSWLAAVRPAALDLGVDPGDVEAIVIADGPEGSPRSFNRGGDGLWYSGPGEGEVLVRRQHVLEDLAEALLHVDVLEVESAGNAPAAGARGAEVGMRTEGGFSVDYRLLNRNGESWIRIVDVAAGCNGDNACPEAGHPKQRYNGLLLKTPAALREIVADAARL